MSVLGIKGYGEAVASLADDVRFKQDATTLTHEAVRACIGSTSGFDKDGVKAFCSRADSSLQSSYLASLISLPTGAIVIQGVGHFSAALCGLSYKDQESAFFTLTDSFQEDKKAIAFLYGPFSEKSLARIEYVGQLTSPSLLHLPQRYEVMTHYSRLISKAFAMLAKAGYEKSSFTYLLPTVLDKRLTARVLKAEGISEAQFLWVLERPEAEVFHLLSPWASLGTLLSSARDGERILLLSYTYSGLEILLVTAQGRAKGTV